MPNSMDGHIYDQEGKDGNSDGNSSKTNQRQGKWKKIISEGAAMAKQQGKLPAGLERMIEDILDSKIGWKEKLYKYIVDQIVCDFTWSKPSKRSWGLNTYLPSPLKESIKIVASVDTSGSIGEDELQAFLSELVSIGNSFENIEIEIIVCDAAVHETYVLDKNNVDDIMNLKMSGGGGTSHEPIIKHIKENITDCKIAVHFTDGYSDINNIKHDDLDFDNLWIISKGGVSEKDIQWGDVINLKES
jgi:predicted metal-dependent peptidase